MYVHIYISVYTHAHAYARMGFPVASGKKNLPATAG